jgi:hypothetical protein
MIPMRTKIIKNKLLKMPKGITIPRMSPRLLEVPEPDVD